MMSNTIQSLINTKIVSAEKTHDYWQISVDKGIINIYNPVKYCKANNDCDLGDLQMEEILNQVIINATYKELQYVQLELDNKGVLTVSLSEEDYTGPEAISLHLDTGEVIVFE